jgi:hypothetical protein
MKEMKAFKEALHLSAKNLERLLGWKGKSLHGDIKTILGWAHSSGVPWTVKRLKVMKTIALQFIAGTPSLGKDPILRWEELTAGLKTFRDPGKPSLPALSVFIGLNIGLKANNRKTIQACLDLLNTYNVFKGPGDDLKEKIEVITRERDFSDKEVSNFRARLYKHSGIPKLRTLNQKFDGPDIGGARYAQRPGVNTSSIDALIPSASYIPSWLWKTVPGLKDFLGQYEFFSLLRNRRQLFLTEPHEPAPFWGGNLAVIGEPGLKTRVVFVSTPWIQGILKPSMIRLQDVLLGLSTDCTFDQGKGIKWLKERTSEGCPVYSVDLSAATDNFPFALQRMVGSRLGVPSYALDIMKQVGFYLPPSVSEGDSVLKHYGVGQGMGLYPSFPLFAVTHNYILITLSKELGLEPDKCFRVLGDDVIISDTSLVNAYASFLNEWDIPISYNKTFCSRCMGEFAGKIIWNGHDITPIKWRVISRESVNVFSQYSDRGLVDFNPSTFLINHVPLCDPFMYPFLNALRSIPKHLGGFGELTHLPLMERLNWGPKKIRALRAGLLERFSERIHMFLTAEPVLKQTDLRKVPVFVNKELRNRELMEDMMMGVDSSIPSHTPGTDMVYHAEGLRSLEKLAFRQNSVLTQLGKYHAWFIAKIGPNPSRELNRILTMTGEAYEALNVCSLPVEKAVKFQLPKPRNPKLIESLYEAAEKRYAELRNIRSTLDTVKELSELSKPGDLETVSKIVATGVATVLGGPVGGLLTGGVLFLNPGEDPDSIKQRSQKLLPLLDGLVPHQE